jgi:hypothetical protein
LLAVGNDSRAGLTAETVAGEIKALSIVAGAARRSEDEARITSITSSVCTICAIRVNGGAVQTGSCTIIEVSNCTVNAGKCARVIALRTCIV